MYVVPILIALSSVSATSVVPETISYSKVSKNGQETYQVQNPLSWMTSSHNSTNNSWKNMGRSAQDITITLSPVYSAPKIPKLKPGEAVNHPSTKKYSSLDKERLTKLEALSAEKQAHERYTPPAYFAHNRPYNKVQGTSNGNAPSSEISDSDINFPGPIFSPVFDYTSSQIELDSNPQLKPSGIKMHEYSSDDNEPNIPHVYHNNQGKQEESPPEFHPHVFDSEQFYENKPPKSGEYTDHFDHPTFVESSYSNSDGISFDGPPDDHELYHHQHYHHDHIHTTTEKPDINDQRLSKRPYSYYYIGKKLWYIPLYFSIYFIIYVAALILKSIARHKINFPTHLAAAAADARYVDQNGSNWWDFPARILEAVERYNKTV